MFDKNGLSCARRRPEIPYQGGPLLMQRRPNNTQMIFVQHVFWQSCLQQPQQQTTGQTLTESQMV